ncbi:hypothetical protein OROGR_003150 [Orobanche gracilis]
MGGKEEGWGGWTPSPGGAPTYTQKDDHWTHFDNSSNAVSFGFVATAVLISMFLLIAIFEKLLRTTSSDISPDGGRRINSNTVVQNHIGRFNSKLGCSSPKNIEPEGPTKFISVNAREVSVVMPGNNVPTFIANPVPVPCPPERMPWPSHQNSNQKLPF